MTNTPKKRPVARTALLAAVMVMALVVTAAAADLATGGELLGRVFSFTRMDDSHLILIDDKTGETRVVTEIRAQLEEREGRIFLLTQTEELDITDELLANSFYRHTYEDHDGKGNPTTVVIDVTPDGAGGWQTVASAGDFGIIVSGGCTDEYTAAGVALPSEDGRQITIAK